MNTFMLIAFVSAFAAAIGFDTWKSRRKQQPAQVKKEPTTQMSDYDILVRIIGFSEDEAKDIIARKKSKEQPADQPAKEAVTIQVYIRNTSLGQHLYWTEGRCVKYVPIASLDNVLPSALSVQDFEKAKESDLQYQPTKNYAIINGKPQHIATQVYAGVGRLWWWTADGLWWCSNNILGLGCKSKLTWDAFCERCEDGAIVPTDEFVIVEGRPQRRVVYAYESNAICWWGLDGVLRYCMNTRDLTDIQIANYKRLDAFEQEVKSGRFKPTDDFVLVGDKPRLVKDQAQPQDQTPALAKAESPQIYKWHGGLCWWHDDKLFYCLADSKSGPETYLLDSVESYAKTRESFEKEKKHYTPTDEFVLVDGKLRRKMIVNAIVERYGDLL